MGQDKQVFKLEEQGREEEEPKLKATQVCSQQGGCLSSCGTQDVLRAHYGPLEVAPASRDYSEGGAI